MSLAHAILGFLQITPQTGYDLKNKRFDKTVAHFWPGDQTQIYKTLDKLVEQGFAKSELEVQESRPNRKIYSITKKGEQELRRWLKQPAAAQAHRYPILIKLFFGEFITDEEVQSVLSAERQQREGELEKLQSIPLPRLADCKTKIQLFARLTLELGLKLTQSYIDWIDLAGTSIRSFQKKQKKKR